MPARRAVALLLPFLASCAGLPPFPWTVEVEVRQLATGMGFVEGPVWIEADRALVFSDIPGAKLMRWSEADGLTVLRDAPNPNGNALDVDRRLLTCQHGARNLVRDEGGAAPVVLADRYEGKRLNSPNDLAVQRDGVIWFTDPPWGLERQTIGRELPGNWVFRLDPGTGDLRPVLKDRAMPNGIALSRDERTLYVSDTGGHPAHPDETMREAPATVSAYDLVGGELASAEPRWRTEIRSDGMCVDGGFLWITESDRLVALSRDGHRVFEVPIPEGPANVCVGGARGRTLFVTARTSLYAIDLSNGLLGAAARHHAHTNMTVHLTTGTPDLARSEAYFERIGFTKVSKDPVLYSDGKALIEIDPARTARPGVRVRRSGMKQLREELETFGPVVELDEGKQWLIAAPSGTWVTFTGALGETEDVSEPGALGNYAGISLETTRLADSIRFWELLGFAVSAGGADQGWVSLTHEPSGAGVSLMKPGACPHTFVNPSLTYFNSGKNPEIIAELRRREVPIHEEVTVFNPDGGVDNVILREPGGLGFFVFND